MLYIKLFCVIIGLWCCKRCEERKNIAMGIIIRIAAFAVVLFGFTASLVHNERPGKAAALLVPVCFTNSFFPPDIPYLPHGWTFSVLWESRERMRPRMSTVRVNHFFREMYFKFKSKGQWLRRQGQPTCVWEVRKNHFTPIAQRWHLKYLFGKQTQLIVIERLNLIPAGWFYSHGTKKPYIVHNKTFTIYFILFVPTRLKFEFNEPPR